jgi:hypothetical protein
MRRPVAVAFVMQQWQLHNMAIRSKIGTHYTKKQRPAATDTTDTVDEEDEIIEALAAANTMIETD